MKDDSNKIKYVCKKLGFFNIFVLEVNSSKGGLTLMWGYYYQVVIEIYTCCNLRWYN